MYVLQWGGRTIEREDVKNSVEKQEAWDYVDRG